MHPARGARFDVTHNISQGMRGPQPHEHVDVICDTSNDERLPAGSLNAAAEIGVEIRAPTRRDVGRERGRESRR